MQPRVHVREGILSSTAFPGLIVSILRQQETGVLTLTGESSEKAIFIQSGSPVFATSNDRDDRLGQIYFKSGRLPLESLMAALEEALRSRKRLGTVLVEMALIAPQELVDGVRTQVRSIVTGLFQWTRGRYRYVPGPLPSEESITLKVSPGNVVLEGIRRIESWERIWEAVGGLDAQYRTAEAIDDEGRDLRLSLAEWTLLSHCDRPLRLREICRVSTLTDFETCRLLWALQVLGLIVRVSPTL